MRAWAARQAYHHDGHHDGHGQAGGLFAGLEWVRYLGQGGFDLDATYLFARYRFA